MTTPPALVRWAGASARRPVSAALATTVLALPLIVLFTHQWASTPPAVPIDFDYFGPAGADLLRGRWTLVFHDPAVQAGPLELLPYGVADLLRLSGTAAWTVFYTVVVAVLTFGVALLARPGRDSGARGALIGAVCAILATAQALLPNSVTIGHPAEIVTPLLWLASARLAQRDRAVAASIVVALSAGFEVWGVLGAPVVLLAGRTRLRRPAAAGAAVLALMYGPFAASGGFAMFAFHWPVSAASVFHLLQPGLTAFPWTLRVLQGSAAIVVGSICAVLLRRSTWAPWIVVLSIAGTRLLLDPVLEGYYWLAPSVVVVAMIAAAGIGRNLRMLALAAACDLACSLPVAAVPRAALLLLVVAAAVAVEAVRLREPASSAAVGRPRAAAMELVPPA